MATMVISVLGIAGSLALLILTAAAGQPLAHLVVAAVMSLLIAVKCASEQRRASGNPVMVASMAYHYIGLAWLWAALALLVTYNFILQWREWLHYFLACAVLAAISLFLASALRKDAESSNADATMTKVARTLAMILMVAMVPVVAGLLVHTGKTWELGGKMAAVTKAGVQRAGSQEWAGNNIFFFGAVSIALLAWTAYAALGKVRR